MSLSDCLSKINAGKEVFSAKEITEIRAIANKNTGKLSVAQAETAAVQELLDQAIAERQELSDMIRDEAGLPMADAGEHAAMDAVLKPDAEDADVVVKQPYGVNTMAGIPAFSQAKESASEAPKDTIVRVRIEKEGLYDSEPVKILYGAFIANGDGTATWAQAQFPASKENPSDAQIIDMAKAERLRNKATEEKIAAQAVKNKAGLKDKGIVVGTELQSPETYVPGKKGMTTFSRAKVVAIDEHGIAEVHATLKGSGKTYIFKADANSRLFDKLEGKPAEAAPVSGASSIEIGDYELQQLGATSGEWKTVQKYKTKSEADAALPKGSGWRINQPESKSQSDYGDLNYDGRIHTAAVHKDMMQRVFEGNVTIDEFKSSFEALASNKEGILAELNAMTKAALFKEYPGLEWRYKNDKKADVAKAALSGMQSDFTLGQSFSYGMGKNAYEEGLRAVVNKTTADDLAKFAESVKTSKAERAAQRAEAEAGMENPETLEDFQRIMAAKAKEIGEDATFGQARMAMTVEHRAKFDELTADKSRAERASRKTAQQEQSLRAPGEAVETTEIIKTKHTKHGHDLWQFQMVQRVAPDEFKSLATQAKRLGGDYSSYRGNGAIPGWQFRTEEAAKAFKALVAGDTAQAKDVMQTRRDAYADDRGQTAVERLTEMAEKLDERADESLSYDRKQNTARRARFAASAESAANSDKAMAQTMRNIAKGIEDGTAKMLDKVRQKVQVETLRTFTQLAFSEQQRLKYPDYADQVKHQGESPTIEAADYAKFPSYTAFRSDLANIGRALSEVDGTKKLGQRLMKVADDVSASYLKFAKENINKVATFKSTNSEMAVFASKDAAEAAISRSNFRGQAIVLPFKRGENLIILSPSEAIKRGIWEGDNDKRITLSADFGAELVESIGRAERRGGKVSVPWQFENAYNNIKRLAGMGIETPAELRAALREYIGLREAPKEADKIKQLERAMIGRANDGMDFFPTPDSVADEMIEAADIKEGMSVLEPSAGMGHIADRLRESGIEPDVVELSGSRRELLEAKGYTLVGGDFMEMKPREVFTYGDTFKAKDGTEGVMRGHTQDQLGNGRVRLLDDKGDSLGFFNRDELTPVKQNGANSGYDRIIMNPPFGDRRDAEHVQHAYSLLKPGGRMVAIMGEGVFFGKDKAAQEFRDWLEQVGGTDEKLPEGSFLDPSLPVNTGVAARMVVINKESGAAKFSRANSYPELAAALEKYEGTGELATVQDLANEVDALIGEGLAPDSLESAIEAYRQEIADDHAYAGRGDMESADERFVDAVRSVLAEKQSRDIQPLVNAHTLKSAQSAMLDAHTGADKKALESLIDSGKARVITAEQAQNITQNISESGEDGRALAFFNQKDGITYFIADNIPQGYTAEKWRGLVRHEIGVHAFQLGKTSAEFQSTLKQVEMMKKAKNPKVIAAFNSVPEDTAPENVTEEAVAYLSQNNPELPVIKRILAWFRNAIRAIGKSLPMLQRMEFFRWADNLTVDDVLHMAQSAMSKSVSTETSREYSGQGVLASMEATSSLVQQVWKKLAANNSLFKTKRNDELSMEGNVLSAMNQKDDDGNAPESLSSIESVEPSEEMKEKYGVVKMWEVISREDEKPAYIMQSKKGHVWMNVSSFKSGKSGGAALYTGVLDYCAKNKGLKLLGDPLGVTDIAMIRRTEIMMSAAIRHGGRTDFMEPSLEQRVPTLFKGKYGHNDWFLEEFTPVKWGKSDAENLDSLINSAQANISLFVPEIKNVHYNFATGELEIDIPNTDGQQTGEKNRRVSVQSELGAAAIHSAMVSGFSRAKNLGIVPDMAERSPYGTSSIIRVGLGKSIRDAANSGRGAGELLSSFEGELPSVLKGALYSKASTTEQPKETPRILRMAKKSGIENDISLIDKVGRGAFKLVGWNRIVEPALDTLLERSGEFIPEKIKAGMVADYGLSDEYVDRKAEMKAAEAAQNRKAAGMVEMLVNLTRAESRVAYQWMQEKPDTAKEKQLLDQLPKESREVLVTLKNLISDMGKEAVKLGQLSPEAYERNNLAYLNRTYAKYVIQPEGKIAQFLRTRALKIKGNQYKGRGIFDEVEMKAVGGDQDFWRKLEQNSPDKSLVGQKVIRFERRDASTEVMDAFPGMQSKPLGKLREIVYWPESQPVPKNFGDWVNAGTFEVRNTKGNKLVVWRDFTPEERTRMGELDEVRYAVAQTLQAMTHDIEIGRFFAWTAKMHGKASPEGDEVAANTSMLQAYTKDSWVHVPEALIPGTQVKKYGALAGLYVPGPIWNDIRQVNGVEFNNPFSKGHEATLQFWKKAKALALDTPIPTIDGWTTMGEIQVGDKIFDEKGQVCEVLHVTPVQLNRQCYEVAFSDGTKIVADEEHFWFTIMQKKPGVRTTKEILDTLKEPTRGDNNHLIPVAGALELPSVELPIPPYALGVWLGDGDTRSARITAGGDDVIEIIGHMNESGIKCGKPNKDKRNNVHSFQMMRSGDGCTRGHDVNEIGKKGCRVCANDSRRLRLQGLKLPAAENPNLQTKMRKIGLLGDKHIPSQYLRASEHQRRELLMGLMDTDGNILKTGICAFVTSLPRLRDDVLELLRSLGYKPTTSEMSPSCNGKAGKPAWRINFKAYSNAPAFKLARKKERQKDLPATKQRSQTRQIVAITPVASVPVRCIAVSSESKLYLAGNGMVPTHNTAWSPAVHMNNVMANFVIADWHDLRAIDMAEALLVWANNKKPGYKEMYQRFEDSGALGGMFLSNEVLRDTIAKELESLKAELTGEQEAAGEAGRMAKVMHLVTMAGMVPKGYANKMEDAYQFEDAIFRLAAFTKAVRYGKIDTEAGRMARHSFLNYDINAPWVQAARHSFLPFVSFFYRAAPMLLNTVKTKPWKILKLVGFIHALSAAGAFLAGSDDDEEEKNRRLLPDEKQGNIWGVVPKMVRTPWDNEDGAPIYLDIRRWVPVGDVFDVGQSSSSVPSWMTPGGPAFLALEVLWANKSVFASKDIMLDSDTLSEATEKAADHIFKGMLPNVPLPNPLNMQVGGIEINPLGLSQGSLQPYAWSGIEKAVDKKEGHIGEIRSIPQAIAGTIGIKAAAYPETNMKAAYAFDLKRSDSEIRNEIRKDATNYSNLESPTPRQEATRNREIANNARKLALLALDFRFKTQDKLMSKEEYNQEKERIEN